MTATLTGVRVSPRAARHARPQAARGTAAVHEDVRDESTAPDIVDIWGLDSFPASDPPGWWAGSPVDAPATTDDDPADDT